MNRAFKVIYIIISLLFVGYLLLPTFPYPRIMPDSLQSNEPGDTEDPLRRAYFTDLNREEVMNYYSSEFTNKEPFNALGFLTYRLNYPPEEAYNFIKDQTRSTFLEEIVHPFRESFFVNGFKPSDPKDAILISERVWLEKITVKYVPSNVYVRVAVGVLTMGLLWFILVQWEKIFLDLRRIVKK